MSDTESEEKTGDCCEDGECTCSIDLEDEVELLQSEVQKLREEVDFIIDRKGLRELMDDE